jgi:trehalose 6-phosphate phosphatase
MPRQVKQIRLDDIDAIVFDMDGVVTRSAQIHAAAWKEMFDEYLSERASRSGEEYEPFDIATDYRRYVDGKSRYDGTASFLKSRGIAIPYGDPSDDPAKETVCGLGNRKNLFFLNRLKTHGTKPYRSTIDFINEIRKSGIRVAVISASLNAKAVLEGAGVDRLFDTAVDGVDAAALGLRGKP